MSTVNTTIHLESASFFSADAPNPGAPLSPLPPVGTTLTAMSGQKSLYKMTVIGVGTQRTDGSYDIPVSMPANPPSGTVTSVASDFSNWVDVPFSRCRDFDLSDYGPTANPVGLVTSYPDDHRLSLADLTRPTQDLAWGKYMPDGVTPSGYPGWPLPEQASGNWTHLAYRAAAGTKVLYTFEAVKPQAMWLGPGTSQEQVTVVSSVPWTGTPSSTVTAPDGWTLHTDSTGQIYAPDNGPNNDRPLFVTTLAANLGASYKRGAPLLISSGTA